jgi:hypothetical protein
MGDPHSFHPWRRRLRRAAIVSAVCVLVAFHVWLFVGRVADGRVSDPLVAMRWGTGFLLAGLLATLKVRGLSPLRSRSAAACWVLVLFLHWSAFAPGAGQAADLHAPALPGGVLVALPVAGWLGALAGGILLLLASRRTQVPGLALSGRIIEAHSSARRSPRLAFPRSLRSPPVVG